MAKMKVKLIHCTVKGKGIPGSIVDLEKGHARHLIGIGHAEEILPEPPEEKVNKTEGEDPKPSEDEEDEENESEGGKKNTGKKGGKGK